MKCQNLFSGENEKSISIYCLLKILPRVLSVRVKFLFFFTAPLGKRSWKMYFVVLRDMILYLHKDEHEMKKKGMVEGSHNVILIHHSLATKATDYSKKQHVFRLQTADWAQYLFQTSNSKELQEWIDTVNFVAASLSAPPLPGAVGSQKKFQRPLLPISYTRFNLVSSVSSPGTDKGHSKIFSSK